MCVIPTRFEVVFRSTIFMETPPEPMPRSGLTTKVDPQKKPVPLPRTKVPIPSNDNKLTASEILRTITSASKQMSEDVASRVQSSAKMANEKFEKSIQDGSRFAKNTLEKTMATSRAVRDSVTKSVIEGTRTAGRNLNRIKPKKPDEPDTDTQRCVSLPMPDVSLFDHIQFHSPLLEQKRFNDNTAVPASSSAILPLNLNSMSFDDMSLFSNNSDSNTDVVSNFSHESTDFEQNTSNTVSCETDSVYDASHSVSRASSATNIPCGATLPEIPKRKKKQNEDIVFLRQNSLYENWELPCAVEKTVSRPSKSTIFEFDPLKECAPKFEGVSNELLLLESFIIGDTYGTIMLTENIDSSEEYPETDYFNPPTPPERTDSLFLPEEEKINPARNTKDSSSNWFLNGNEDEVKIVSDDNNKPSKVMQRFSHILKLDVLNKTAKQNTVKKEVVERPPLNHLPTAYYNGLLTRIVSGVVEDLFKNAQTRYCLLSDGKLMCYSDPANNVLKEIYPLENIYSIQIVLPLTTSTTPNSFCFEIAISNGVVKSHRKLLFSCNSASERRNWAQKIVEHLTHGFPTRYISEYTRCGWCYLKEGVSSEWRGAWLMLIRRVLVYYTTHDPTVSNVDLRKTRCVVTQDADETAKSFCPADGSPNLLLDCPHATLYLRFPHEKELKGWRQMIKLAAYNNGTYIHHQQLTKDNVPTVVDKCISFIYAYGSLTEGIYRRAGSSSVLAELLARFRRDAWSVQLSPATHSEHDVAGVLKRFFRDLPEPLIPNDYHTRLVEALKIKDKTLRHAEYRKLMASMPVVPRNTIRKLFGHLYFLNTMERINKMTAENLASVWAPTIMPSNVSSENLITAWSSTEVLVVRDLILNYESVWQPSESEQRREAAVRRILERVSSNSAATTPKAAGHLKAWVHVHDRTNCYQVALTPNKTSADLCIELAEKAGKDSHDLMVEEVICGESLRRIVHINEIVLDVVLRWGYWDEDDRKDNYLLVKENEMLRNMVEMKKNVTGICGELKFANESTKTFKQHIFEIDNAKLYYFKDKQNAQRAEEWHIKDILWYMGHESKRNPQSRWSITFISRNNKTKRSKDRPWFGCTIAGSMDDQISWMTALTFSEHNDVLPTPRLIVT